MVNEMIQLHSSACIHAPRKLVWQYLARLENIELWSEQVVKSWCEKDLSQGAGSVRFCKLANGTTIEERWTDWQEGYSYTYQGFNIPMIKRAENTWSVEAVGEQTLLTSKAIIELKGGIFGKLLEPLVTTVMKKMVPDSLAAFKYFVENGRPYEGKHSALPRAQITC